MQKCLSQKTKARRLPLAFLAFPHPCIPMFTVRLYLDHVHELLDCRRRLPERGVFLGGQPDLDDLLDPTTAELDGDTDEQIADAVLTLEVDRAWKDLLLVLQD